MLLHNYIISSHKDKPIGNLNMESKYNIQIQAGAALTDKRICDLNDHDGFPESISDRNARYSEASAMFYISRHIDSDYVGIAQYRRRLQLSDSDFEKYASDNIDIITSQIADYDLTIEEAYRTFHYSADWDLFMDLLKVYDEKDLEYDKAIFQRRSLRGANLHIYRSELFKEFSNWAFPILDEFYKRALPKSDIYQNRDVGFIAERLAHLYVMKAIRDGKKVVEVPMVNLGQAPVIPISSSAEDAFENCNELYSSGAITSCSDRIRDALKNGLINDDILDSAQILKYSNVEMSQGYTVSLHEYIPSELRKDLITLLGTFRGLKKIAILYVSSNGSDETLALLQQYINVTGASRIILLDLISHFSQNEELSETLISKLSFKNYSYR